MERYHASVVAIVVAIVLEWAYCTLLLALVLKSSNMIYSCTQFWKTNIMIYYMHIHIHLQYVKHISLYSIQNEMCYNI